jgi:hypothetical protein
VVDKVVQTLIVPQVGMVFESKEKAIEMYNTYARIIGFSIRNGHSKLRGDKTLSNKYIVCSVIVKMSHHRRTLQGRVTMLMLNLMSRGDLDGAKGCT